MDRNKKALIEKVAEQMMISRGFEKPKNGKYDIEWDHSREDSQYSMVYEDVEFVVQYIESEGSLGDIKEQEESRETVTQSAAIFVFMDAGIGNPSYVSDVRAWLEAVDKAGIPDDTEVDGTLHLSYDIRDRLTTETIECGECGNNDTLLTHHTCKNQTTT